MGGGGHYSNISNQTTIITTLYILILLEGKSEMLEQTGNKTWRKNSRIVHEIVWGGLGEKSCSGRDRGHDQSPSADWCQMVLNHLMGRPMITTHTHTHSHNQFSARYKSCGGKTHPVWISGWQLSHTLMNTHTHTHTDYSLLSWINKPVMNYALSSRNDSTLSLPTHASLHLQQFPKSKDLWGGPVLQYQQLPQRNWLVRTSTNTHTQPNLCLLSLPFISQCLRWNERLQAFLWSCYGLSYVLQTRVIH